MSVTFESARLDALVESARMLQSAKDVDQLLQHLLRSAMAHVLARRGFIARDDGDGAVIVDARGLSGIAAGSPFDEQQLRTAGIDSILTVGTDDRPNAYLGVGATPAPIRPDQEAFLSALVGISAGAIENVRYAGEVRRLNVNLDRKLQELRTLLDLVRSFTAVVDPEEVVRMLALTLAGQWTLSRYAIAAWKEGHPSILRAKGVRLDGSSLRSLASDVTFAIYTDGLQSNTSREELQAQKVAAIIPLHSGAGTMGMILLGARPGGEQ
jgi:hypothetical protein